MEIITVALICIALVWIGGVFYSVRRGMNEVIRGPTRSTTGSSDWRASGTGSVDPHAQAPVSAVQGSRQCLKPPPARPPEEARHCVPSNGAHRKRAEGPGLRCL